jgi:polysaccharide biosynthesis transport protein
MKSSATGKLPIQGLGAEIMAVVHAVKRRWLWIVLATLGALAAAILFLLLTTPRYVATAQILIDPRAKRILEGAVVPGGFGSSAAGADTLLVDSQVELLQSNAVLKKIVESEQLHKDKEFAVTRGGGLRVLLRNTIGTSIFGTEREEPYATDAIDMTIWRFADKHLRVRRVGNTYVINVTVMSSDPAKAARLANALAQAYINDQVRATGDTTREATTALQSRIVELRERVETAENAVETFRTKAGLLGAPNLLVSEQQLQQTNDKLILARSQAALAKARFDQVKDLSARGGAALLGAQSDALKSPVIANLRSALSRVERREAIIQQTLKPGHPEYASAQVEKRAVMTQIEEELSRIKANAKGEYELAASTERATAAELKSMEAQTSTSNKSQVRLRELQREAQSARAIFEQFLNREKETREQEGLGRENTRIISEATVPPYPAFPPTLLVLGGALLAGLLGGAATAWLGHLLSAPTDPAVSGASTNSVVRTVSDVSTTSTRRDPPQLRTRMRSLLAPRLKQEAANNDAAAPPEEPSSPATLAKLPAIAKLAFEGTESRSGAEAPSFSDHIAAVDDLSAAAYPGYRSAIESLLSALTKDAKRGQPIVTLLVGIERGAGTSSTALALAYRAAILGQRTLLIDVSNADAGLSQVFASNLTQRRACILDSEAHLAEITLNDSRTGLSLLPLALADLSKLTLDQQERLRKGLSRLIGRFDLVVIDAGAARDAASFTFATSLASKVLVITPDRQAMTGLARLEAMSAANRFRTADASAAIIETSAR